MASTAHPTSRRTDGRTPAQWYCLLAGAALLGAGLLGFIADASFDTGDGIDGGSLIGFEVNGIHNLVHIASGAVLLAVFSRRGPAKTVALAFGLVYGLVTIIGIADGEDVLGLIPINTPDNILHVALSGAGILAAIASPGDTGGRRRDATARTDGERGERFGRDRDTLTGPARSEDEITRTGGPAADA